MNGEMGEVLTAIGALTEAVGTLKKDLRTQGISTNEYREHIHESNSMRDQKINGIENCLERLTTLVDEHETIASSISPQYLDRLDQHHAHIAKDIAKTLFWETMRARLLEKGLLIGLLLLGAAVLFAFGFEDLAKKMVG